MTFLSKLKNLAACLALCMLPLRVDAQTAAGAPLRVCLDADNPPFSDQSSAAGIDVDVAQALASALERPLRPVWVTIPARGGLGKALRESLQGGQCELFLGLPNDPEMQADLRQRQLLASAPYITLGYLTLIRTGAAVDLDTLPRGARIGAVTATPADLYLHKHADVAREPFNTSLELINAVRGGEIIAALVWTSALAREYSRLAGLQTSAERLCDADLRSGIMAALRRDPEGHEAQIAKALARLSDDGSLRRIAEAHHLPWLEDPAPGCGGNAKPASPP